MIRKRKWYCCFMILYCLKSYALYVCIFNTVIWKWKTSFANVNIENMRRAKSSRTHSFKTFQFVSIHSLPTSFLFFAGILFRENLHESIWNILMQKVLWLNNHMTRCILYLNLITFNVNISNINNISAWFIFNSHVIVHCVWNIWLYEI